MERDHVHAHNTTTYIKPAYLDHQLSGRYEKSFGISKNLIPDIKSAIIKLYVSSGPKNLLYPEQINSTLLNIFTNIYYPDISRNLHVDSNNTAVIMGGIAFNQNIPQKLNSFLNMNTDDIDLKIYTTDITPFNKGQPRTYAKTLSLFKFISLIIPLYLKQILTYIINLEDIIFEQQELSAPKDKGKSTKHSTKQSTRKSTHKSTQHLTSTKLKKTKKYKNTSTQAGGANLISYKNKWYGILKKYRIIVQIKHHQGDMETIDITEMNYSEIIELIIPKINDPDLMITTKAQYKITYSKVLKPAKKRNTITFSDCKIIYPNVDYPSYYTYYLMNQKHSKNQHMKQRRPLDDEGGVARDRKLDLTQLTNKHLKLSDVIETKLCKNNGRYISIKSLLIDIVLMLSYAELLQYEKLDINKDLNVSEETLQININKLIQVKLGCIFKYYKYLIKFIRLHIIRKFYESTLKKEFVESCKQLIQYTIKYLRKKDDIRDETDIKNLAYRSTIREFHTGFFITGELMRQKYPELEDLVDNYKNIVVYLNMSRTLFKELESESDAESQNSIMILIASQKMLRTLSHEGGGTTAKKTQLRYTSPIELLSNYKYNDFELDSESTIENTGGKTITTSKSIKTKGAVKGDVSLINDKLDKMLQNELNVLDDLIASID